MFGIKMKGGFLIMIRGNHPNPSFSINPDYRTYMVESVEEAQKDLATIQKYFLDNRFVRPMQLEVYELTEDEMIANTCHGLRARRF